MFANITKMFMVPAVMLMAGSLYAAPKDSTADLKGPVTIVVVESEYPSEAQASELLKQIQVRAVELSKDSATLGTFSRSDLSRQSHAEYLNRVKQQVNQTGEQLGQLEEIKSTSAPWQQDAINQLVPIAHQLASNAEAAINHLNEYPNYRFAPEYNDSLKAIASGATELQNRVNDFLKLAAINDKVDALQQKVDTLQMKLGIS